LINASRAQLVREVIRPALAAGQWVLCDRFYDSTVAYQGYGRGLDLDRVRAVIDFSVGETKPDLTLLLMIPLAVSEERREARVAVEGAVRDRMEEAGRSFFERVEEGYRRLAKADRRRVRLIDATQEVDSVHRAIWQAVEPLTQSRPR